MIQAAQAYGVSSEFGFGFWILRHMVKPVHMYGYRQPKLMV